LALAKVQAKVLEELPESLASVDEKVTEVILIQAPIRKGFASSDAKLILLTDSDFFGRGAGYNQAKRPKLAAKRGQAVDPLALKAGDYVVHEIHGIGRFVEMVQRQMGVGTHKHTREYLTIEYAPSKRGLSGDVLYVPTDQLDFLTRYVGGEAPVLSKMGGSDWSKVKGNARKAVRKIAIDLVKLYSARMNAKGYAIWQGIIAPTLKRD
jgi:transcription-repair coupling factor (superfamily II helicase)